MKAGKLTKLTHPQKSDKVNKFTFDYSYWSFDGCKEDQNGYFRPDNQHPNGNKFADQKRVFDDLGQGILKNAWNGYNSSLFAYGQTGSGKSWSIIGYGSNKGIVPLFCEAIFQGIEERKERDNDTVYEVKLSMLEIYNEVVRDLLNINGDKKKGLRVREHTNKGFYADGLTQALVTSYQGIEQKMTEGTVNRTVAATNMNETSSRAHTIVTVYFVQKHKNHSGQEIAKTATINLVDLAGSERTHSTGATGERLKEGAAINLSLSSLGNCIHALAEISTGKTGIKVPYRDSVLTKLLMNALSGNSKTVMVAAISPADINYEETLSTLRYADRTKQIKTVATVNEDPTEKLIRDLKLENDRLKKMLETGPGASLALGLSSSDLSAAMHENERQMQEMKESYEDKLRMADMISPKVLMIESEKKTKPHLYNLNIDAQLTGKIIHILHSGQTTIGNHRGRPSTITMTGPRYDKNKIKTIFQIKNYITYYNISIQEEHAIITITENNDKFLEQGVPDAKIIHNGDQITRKIALHHNDRVMFGPSQLYVFCDPPERDKSRETYPEVTYNWAMEEIAKKAGLTIAGPGEPEAMVLQDDLLDVLPAVQEANSISADLDKKVKFEIALLAPEILGNKTGQTEVCVKMKNLETGQEFVWPKEKFLNRLYLMKDMYSKYEYDDDGAEDWDVTAENDPFAESPDTEVHIGSVQVFLQPIAYMIELKDQLRITDYKGNEVGVLNIEIFQACRFSVVIMNKKSY
uniref:Kinesin-like protein n=1 Tax=Strigamia maritima TaxID=126957 RepID=T1ISP8_STRMM